MTKDTTADLIARLREASECHFYGTWEGDAAREAADALEAAQARIAELEGDCARLNEGIEAIRQFGSDTLSGPTDISHDTRDWQRAAVRVMTWRAQLLLNGYDWDAEDEGDTPSARAALQEGKG